jgi:2-polyprenyl-6-methoxyphenol hydroxylase-like FAD-dependent oxidoreductase
MHATKMTATERPAVSPELGPAVTERTQVLIVGAGPTGLALALKLAQDGIDFILVDRACEGANTSRAAVVHARTLEALEPLGVADRLVAEGLVVPDFSIRDRDRVLSHISLADLPSRYPYALMIPQSRTEAILHDRLRESGGEVRWECEVVEIREHSSGVQVAIRDINGTLSYIEARYIVGADGIHSIVRDKAGIAFEGATYYQSFILADVKLDWHLRDDEVFLFFSPEGLVVVAPLPGGHHRIVATVDDAPENPDRNDIQTLLDRRGPVLQPAMVGEIVWSSRFHVHHRLANHYVAGRFLLAGDAAHVHSPAGGQGMNTGIQDAIALGDALSKVVGQVSDDRAVRACLQAYEAARRPVGQRVVSMTDKMTRAALVRSRPLRIARNALISILGRIPVVRQRLALRLAELDLAGRPQSSPH